MIDEQTSIVEPDASEPSRIQEIKANIKAGEEWLRTGNRTKKDARWNQWKRSKSMLECDWDNIEGVEKTDFHLNIPFSNYHTVRPSLIFKAPYINTVASKPDYLRDENGEIQKDEQNRPMIRSSNYIAARMMGLRINYVIKKINLKNTLKRVTGDNLSPYGVGWVKVGYQNLSLNGQNNTGKNNIGYFVKRIDPRNVIYDWMATEITEARWVAERLTWTRSQIEAAGLKLPKNYSGKIPEHLDDRKKNANNGGDTEGHTKGGDGELIEFFEYHDLEQNTIDWVLLDGPSKDHFFMADTSHEPYPFEGSGIFPLVLTPDNDDIIGKSDSEPVEEQVLALNRMRTREVHHMDNYGTGVVYEDGAISPKSMENYRKTPYGWDLKVAKGYFSKVKFQGTPSMGSDH